ncbi:MAG TPA: hypothetical protein VHE11_04400, partial [Steroidobacteraceae bacterium]|nr:hypothetical protein [Steroidobacteraceae bacterium]
MADEPPPEEPGLPGARRRSRDHDARTLIEIAHTLDSSVDECQRLTRSLTLLKALLQCDRCSILFDADGDGGRKVLSVPAVTGDKVARLKEQLLTLLRAVEDNAAIPHRRNGQALALPLVGLDEVRGML